MKTTNAEYYAGNNRLRVVPGRTPINELPDAPLDIAITNVVDNASNTGELPPVNKWPQRIVVGAIIAYLVCLALIVVLTWNR